MKVITCTLLATAAVIGAAAKQPYNPVPVIPLCMDRVSEPDLSEQDIFNTREQAVRVFSKVPVNVEWKTGRACQTADVIHVHLADWEHSQALLRSHGIRPELIAPDAIGFAYDATGVALFYDRLRSMVGQELAPYALPYILVHEVTHLLEPEPRHSETGIMKAQWTIAEYKALVEGRLAFAPEDVTLIQVGVKTRSERLLAALRALDRGALN